MSRINIIVLIAFVALLIWIFLFGQETVSRIQRGAQTAISPVISGANKVEEVVTGIGKDTLSVVELKARLEETELEKDRLRLEVLRLDELAEENDALRKALNYVEKSPLKLVPARVISRKPSNWYNTLVIDKGTAAKISPDSPVIVPVGDHAGLVGKVSEVVGDDSSIVILLSDEVCQVSARIEGTAEQGILSGQRGALKVMPDLKLSYLSKDAVAPPGRLVITSGAGGLFPGNLLLGRVKTFTAGPLTGEATVEAAVNFDVLTNVFVILPEPNAPKAESKAEQPQGERATPLAP
ncbi:MAG: rod shape-determining protein MreC [Verrucomicrobiae bacterium]|nr:rod shape-determining protein MreC [Verrucomicrobiae bacterium]